VVGVVAHRTPPRRHAVVVGPKRRGGAVRARRILHAHVGQAPAVARGEQRRDQRRAFDGVGPRADAENARDSV
jgi:hypothetical protein